MYDNTEYPSARKMLQVQAIRARRKACRCLIALPHEVFVDLDDGPIQNLAILRKHRPITRITSWPSTTPGHSHVVVSLNVSLPATELLALMGMLGSDPKHIAFAWKYLQKYGQLYSILFQPLGAEPLDRSMS